jgi:hypothetical protein
MCHSYFLLCVKLAFIRQLNFLTRLYCSLLKDVFSLSESHDIRETIGVADLNLEVY